MVTSVSHTSRAVILIEQCPNPEDDPALGDAAIHLGRISRTQDGLALTRDSIVGLDTEPDTGNRRQYRALPHELARNKTIITVGGIGIRFELVRSISFGRSMILWSRGEIVEVLLTSPTRSPFLLVDSLLELEKLSEPRLYSYVSYRYVVLRRRTPGNWHCASTMASYLKPFRGYGEVELAI